MKEKEDKKMILNLSTVNKIKKDILSLSKKNIDKIPEYLDSIKESSKMKKKVAKSDNEFLNYM